MTHAELTALPELPTPTYKTRVEVIDGERVTLPALHAEFVPWCLPEDPVCFHDKQGRAWEVVRLGDPPRRWKMRRPADDQPQ